MCKRIGRARLDGWMEEHFSLRSVLSWLMEMGSTLAFDLGSFSRVRIFPLSTPNYPTGWLGLEKSLLILDCHCRPEIKTKAPLYSYYSLCVCVQSKVFVLGFES